MTTYDTYERQLCDMISERGEERWLVTPLPVIAVLNDPKPTIKPIIYVIYTGSTFQPTQVLGEIADDEDLTFAIYVIARTRDGANGVLPVINEIEQVLVTARLKDDILITDGKAKGDGQYYIGDERGGEMSQRVELTEVSYVDGIQQAWQYRLSIHFPRIYATDRFKKHNKIKEITIK